MQKSQKAAAKAEAQSNGCLRLKVERRIVELQFFKRIAQILIFRAVRRKNTAVYHTVDLFVTRQCFRNGVCAVGHGIAYLRIAHVFYACGDIAYIACAQVVRGDISAGAENTYLNGLKLLARCHKANFCTFFYNTVKNAHKNDNTLVTVIKTVENKRFQRCILVALGCGDILDYAFEYIVYVQVCLGGNKRCIFAVKTDNVLYLLFHALGLGARQVYLVDNGHNFKVVVKRKIHVCKRLRLNTLRRIDNQHSAVTGSQRTRYLVVEIDMTGGVDKVEYVFLPVLRLVDKAHGLRFNGYTPLALQIHIVKHLLLHLALGKQTRFLNKPVRKS